VVAILLFSLASPRAEASSIYRIGFDGKPNETAKATVKSAFGSANTAWKAFTGKAIELRRPLLVHIVTDKERIPGARASNAKSDCDHAAHLFAFRAERGVPGSDTPPHGPGSVESLEREFVRMAMDALRKDPIPIWLEPAAILATSENPESTFLEPAGFRQLYERGHAGRGGTLPGGPARLFNCIEWPVGNPWTMLVLRFVRDTKGPDAIRRILEKAAKPNEIAALAEGIPVGATMVDVHKFDEQFDAYVRAKFGVAVAAHGGDGGPNPRPLP
jgi:hypothetical protein